jgi:hypothetical protein
MSETITCPSGLTGRIREMKAREARILADRKLARSGAQLEHEKRRLVEWLRSAPSGRGGHSGRRSNITRAFSPSVSAPPAPASSIRS